MTLNITNKTAMGYKSVARMLDCDVKTIQNSVNKLISRGELTEEIIAELPTTKGLRVVKIILESDLNKVLD